MKRVNYDQIADKYNQRYHEDSLAGVERALAQLVEDTNAQNILEAGCGTARWLDGLANSHPEAHFYGLDYSQGMLTQAQYRGTDLQLMRGKGGQLPVKAASFDLVFCVNALHHFHDPAGFVDQAQKILRPGGILAIIGQVPQDRRNRWFVYDYFEGSYDIDLQRFPTWGTVMDWMVLAGFHSIQWEPVEWISADKYGREVLDDPFLQKHAVSQLAMISETAYTAGIEKIKAALNRADAESKTLKFETRLRLDMLAGTTPKDD